MNLRQSTRPVVCAALALSCILVAISHADESNSVQARRQAELRQIFALVEDGPDGQPPAAMSDFARVPWVRQDRLRYPITGLDKTWHDWQERTGELPPDFETMPSQPFLSNPLIYEIDGKSARITSAKDWHQHREKIRKQIEYWITGAAPPPPTNFTSKVVKESEENGITIREVELRFGPAHAAKMGLTLYIPRGPGPWPVFMTQWNPERVKQAVARGYVGCIYGAANGNDDTEDYTKIYPQYDWGMIRRRGWGGSRAIDYLVTLPFVDKSKIGLFGHSRNGKQSLYLAAFDERITAVIASSCFTVGINAIRYSDRDDSQTFDENTYAFPYWFTPRLRFFVGQEHKLPVDTHMVLSLIAPRAVLVNSGPREPDGNAWGVEQTVDAARPVFRLLDAEDNLMVRFRPGQSHSIAPGTVETYCDFFDRAFGRESSFRSSPRYTNYTFERWVKVSGEKVNPADFPVRGLELIKPDLTDQGCADARRRLNWLLGTAPAGKEPSLTVEVENQGPVAAEDFPRKAAPIILPFNMPRWEAQQQIMLRRKSSKQDESKGGDKQLVLHAYLPAKFDAGKRLPVVIYLHGYTYGTGYLIRSGPVLESLAARGFLAIGFDQLGFNSRIDEGRDFYEVHPRWSKVGAMVADVRMLLDSLPRIEHADQNQVYLLGNDIGGTVALITAALDERVAGVTVSGAFTPWRSNSQQIEGIRGWSQSRDLLPRLGNFLGHEDRIPIDYDEILSLIAPRPLQVSAPQLSRHSEFDRVQKVAVQTARVYAELDHPQAFTFEAPINFHRFTIVEKHKMFAWLEQQVRQKP